MNWRDYRHHVVPAGLVLAAVAALWLLIWSPGALRGADTWSHLFKAEVLAEEMHSRGLGAYLTSAWMPEWYLGDPYRTYYPPLTTLVLAPLQYLMADAVLTAKLFVSLALLTYAALVYGFLNRMWGRWPAALGATLAVWAPYQLRTIFFEGNIPRILAFLVLPLIAWQTENVLTGAKHRAGAAAVLGLLWAWTILAHPQQAYMFAIAFALYVAARLFLEAETPMTRAAWWLGGILWGAALTLPWALPAYVGNELPGIPYLPEIKVETFVANFAAILPSFTLTDGRILLGSGTLLLALLAAIARPDARRTGYVFAALATLWFSMGPSSIGFSLLPLHDQLLPERFLNFTAFALPVAAAGILPLHNTARTPRLALVIGLLALDLAPGFSIARAIPYPEEQAPLAGLPPQGVGRGGRTALLTYPEPTALEVYFLGQGSEMLNGWALENTPHHISLRRVLSAPEWGADYLRVRFDLWDVHRVVVRGGEEAGAARAALESIGFIRDASLGPYEVWLEPRGSAPVQRPPVGQMLVVGNDLLPFVGAFPFAEERRVSGLSEIGLAEMLTHPMIGLYRFADGSDGLARAEATLREYLRYGGTVVIDLSGMEDLVGRSLDFLDVGVLRLSYDHQTTLRWDGDPEGESERLDFEGLPEAGWSGAAYLRLDGVLASVEQDGDWYPVLGYKDFGAGRAWFVGLNLFYYSQLTGDIRLSERLRGAALESAPVTRELLLEDIEVRDFQAWDRGLSFTAQLDRPSEAVVSYTYTPRWEVLVDGTSVPFTSYEGLIRFNLPLGEHAVQVGYRPYGTLWPKLGLGLGVFAGLIAIALILVERRAKPAPVAPQKAEAEEPSYAPCANCGFRIAEKYQPTAVTYPFNVVSCPLCGMRMDDEGFNPGQSLGLEQREKALTRWLESHNYNPEQVYKRWGFGVEDFFESSAAAEGGPSSPPTPGSPDANQNPDRG